MKITLKLLLCLLAFSLKSVAQQYPFAIYNVPGIFGQDLNIHQTASVNGFVIDKMPYGGFLTAQNLVQSTDGTGDYFYIVDAPGTSQGLIGYVIAGKPNTQPYCNGLGYVVINNPNTSYINIRSDHSDQSPQVTINGSYAHVYNGQIYTLTGNTYTDASYWWVEIYLTSNCSQQKGWIAGYSFSSQQYWITTYYQSLTTLTQPQLQPAFKVTSTSFSIDWTTYFPDADYFKVYLNDNYTGQTSNLSYDFPSLTPGTFYTFYVTAYDNYSCNSSASITRSITTNDADKAIIDVSGDLAFGDVAENSSSSRLMTIKNTGTVTLNVSSINYPTGFSGDWNSGSIIAGGSQNVTVTFSPTAVQNYGGTITVTSDAASGTNTILCSGTGTSSQSLSINVTGDLTFGDVIVGSNSQKKFTIQNTGSADLSVSSINYPDGFNGDWNNGSISKGDKQEVTVTFSPSSVQSYSGTITVNSNAVSGNNTIDCSGNGISKPVSSIVITNVIPNNSSLSTPKILWSGTTDQNASIIKICADGSTATNISFVNNTGIDSKNIRFWIKSDPYGNNTDISGYFVLTDYSYNGATITVKLTHPNYLTSSYTPFRTDTIEIVDYTTPTPAVFSIPIEIFRAPVLMVHGLWADQSTFQNMENMLDGSGYYPQVITNRVNYYSTNSYSFAYNASVVPIGINSLLLLCRNNEYSAGKVDLIGHSMGGLLEREYIQSLNYKNDVHKLITINTPHSGTQSANFLKNIRYSNLSNIMWAYGYDDSNGAIDDLETNSSAIYNLYLGGLSSNYANVGCHAITTESNYFSHIGWDFLLADQEALAAGFFVVDNFLSLLYQGEDNDLIVPMSSQQGGLTTEAISFFNNEWHGGSCDNTAIQNDVLNLINDDPNSSVFDHSGFQPYPFPLTSIFGRSDLDSGKVNHLQSSGKITINYPSTNMTFEPGQEIQIDASSDGTINHLTCIEGNFSLGTTYADTSLSKAIFNYTIPENAIGKLLISVVGADSFGIVDYDTVSININVTATLDSMQFYPSEIVVPVNANSSITCTGFFNDGVSRNLNFVNGLQYEILDTNIAKYISSNMIFGKQIGNTMLNLQYQEITVQVPVIVFPQDTSIVITTSTASPHGAFMNSNLSLLKIYPNPNSGEFSIQFKTAIGEPVYITVYDQYGQKVLEQNKITDAEIYLTYLNLNKASSGIYYVNVRSKVNSVSGKLIVLK